MENLKLDTDAVAIKLIAALHRQGVIDDATYFAIRNNSAANVKAVAH
ncbi:MAG: hypothetical protein PHU79_09735 [Oscillospiraceae bacterium]|nr:hypothetical protein [Oscillospiraceae bacterium]